MKFTRLIFTDLYDNEIALNEYEQTFKTSSLHFQIHNKSVRF